MRPIAVFDTNILLSALMWPKGKPFGCLDSARQRYVDSITCEEILEEFREKLVGKFKKSADDAKSAAVEVRKFSKLVSIKNEIKVVRDPDDDKIIECAVNGRATHIVTGDKRHLLRMGTYQGIEILTASDFLMLVDKQ